MPASIADIDRVFDSKAFNTAVTTWRSRLCASDAPHTLALGASERLRIARTALGTLKTIARALGDDVSCDQVSDMVYKGRATLLDGFATILRERFGGTVFRNDFEDWQYYGPNAPFVFCRRLLGLPMMEQLHARHPKHMAKYENESAARRRLGKAIENFIELDWRCNKPCMVIHSADQAHGLSALAGHLVRDQYEQVGLKSLPRCLLTVSAHAPPHSGIDLPLLLHQILAFYKGQWLTDARSGDWLPEATKPMSEAEVRRAIAEIRRNMTLYPAIFVFDGVQDYGTHLPDLRSTMVDDPFVLLIEHLMFPDLGDFDAPSSRKMFGRNRFIILSNGPCRSLSNHVHRSVRLPFPDPEFAKNGIKTFGLYHHGDALQQYCEDQDTNDGASEVNLQFADALMSMGVARSDLAAPSGLALQFCKVLADERPGWLFPLAALLLTPGGLFARTLLELARVWREHPIIDAPLAGLGLTAALDAPGLTTFHSALKSMLSLAPDSTLQELDAFRPPAPDAGDLSRSVLSFVTPATAQVLRQVLMVQIEEVQLLRLEALLADESLTQHTQIMRLSEREDYSSIRKNRRLLEGLYHGLLSIDFKFKPTENSDLELLLPESSIEKFIQIYARYYRPIMEAPPNWDVSRLMSGEDVKRDLLELAIRPAQSLHQTLTQTERVQPQLPAWLSDAAKRNRAFAIVANELYHSLCQALLQLGDFKAFDLALAAARDLADQTARQIDGGAADDALDKLEIDGLILRGQLAKALRLTRKRLHGMGWKKATQIKAQAQLSNDVFSSGKMLQPLVAGLDAATSAKMIPLLERYGEILATCADRRSDCVKEVDKQRLRQAYVLFSLADQVRRQLSQENPFAHGVGRSGHATRIQIRMLLLLRHHIRDNAPEAEQLLKLARRRADSLTRMFSRYPAERPSMLIIEGMFLRLSGTHSDALGEAHRALLEADRQLIWASGRPRVRMRLLFERVKLLNRLSAQPDPRGRIFADWADYDLEMLERLAAASGSALWLRLANRARRRSPARVQVNEKQTKHTGSGKAKVNTSARSGGRGHVAAVSQPRGRRLMTSDAPNNGSLNGII